MTKRRISWEELITKIQQLQITKDRRVYGVPKGGMIAAGFLENGRSVPHPEQADIILDDLIDSGATRDKFQQEFPDKPFVALFDKQKMGTTDWLVMPWEADHPNGEDSIEENIKRQLQYIGEDVNREGLRKTPERIVRAWDEIFRGYKQNPEDLLTTFDADGCDQIVLLKNIELFSVCEHHLLPFFGKAHVAYIPKDRVIGISKLARLVDIYARRAQIQERIGEQVTSALMSHLNPMGAACIIEAVHLCMRMRGCSKQGSTMVTSSMKGVFFTDSKARQELLELIK